MRSKAIHLLTGDALMDHLPVVAIVLATADIESIPDFSLRSKEKNTSVSISDVIIIYRNHNDKEQKRARI